MNELIRWDEIEKAIDIEKDFKVLSELHGILESSVFRRKLKLQHDGSYRAVNKAEKYKIRIEARIGEEYSQLDSKPGRPEINSSDGLTNKQQLQDEIDKSRESLNKYVKISEVIKKKPELLEEYENICNENNMGMSSEGFLKFKDNRNILVNKFTSDNEWNTPRYIVDAVKRVLGEIDLDPASNEVAQKLIGAKKYYTVLDNALEETWHGKVFLNPPYSSGLIDKFVMKLLDSIEQKTVTEAILLTNNNTDTKWFTRAAIRSNLLCFTIGRISFYKEDGSESQPTNGQVFFYYGENPDSFTFVFHENIGYMYECW